MLTGLDGREWNVDRQKRRHTEYGNADNPERLARAETRPGTSGSVESAGSFAASAATSL
jgi:hypothetical protein